MKPLMNLRNTIKDFYPYQTDCLAIILILSNLHVQTHFLMTLTAHARFSRSFLAIRPLQQFSIFVAFKIRKGNQK